MRWVGRCVALAAATATLVACAQYKLVGTFERYNEYFVGDLNHNLMVGRADIVVVGQNSGLTCRGHSEVTYKPPFGIGCAGQRGIAVMQCDDGRVVDATWEAESCTSGFGRGVDDTGAAVRFTFGQTEAEALADLEGARADVAGRPELPVYRPREVREERGFATGTAFAVAAGQFVTNFHVVDGAERVSLVVDEQLVPARVLAVDADHDLALIASDVDARPLPVAPRGSARVGEEVIALGFPIIDIYGQTQRATFGRINALRGLGDNPVFLQMDAGIQPGNSGGPLLDDRGRVVGVVTATLSVVALLESAGTIPQNANFAVQVEYLRDFLSRAAPNWASAGGGRGGSLADHVARSESSVLLVVTE